MISLSITKLGIYLIKDLNSTLMVIILDKILENKVLPRQFKYHLLHQRSEKTKALAKEQAELQVNKLRH